MTLLFSTFISGLERECGQGRFLILQNKNSQNQSYQKVLQELLLTQAAGVS